MARRIPSYRPPGTGLPSARRPRSERSKAHQGLLNSPAWRRYSKAYLLDHPLCLDCQAEGRLDQATEVHHKIKPNGDRELFWLPGNHLGLCRSCHQRRTARGE